MEKKKEDFNSKIKQIEEMRKRRNANQSNIKANDAVSEDSDSSENDVADVDEYLDWRSKKIL